MEEKRLKLESAIRKFENDLKSLKKEWDFFFGGQRRTPPLKELETLEKFLKDIKNGAISDNTLRFKFNSLYSNFTSQRELWKKKLKLIEEGKIKIQKQNMEKNLQKPKEVIIPKRGNINEQIETIYSNYMSNLGEKSKPPSFIDFEKKLRQQFLEIFRKINCPMIKVYVTTEEGKAKIKVKPIKEK